MQVDTILRSKGAYVETIGPDAPARMAAHRMASNRLGCLVVSDDGSHVDGLITERDLVRALATRGPDMSTWRVRDVMSHDVPTCAPTEDVTSLMRTMTRRRYRHVPVVRDGMLVGIVSIGDVVKHRLSDMELQASVLRDVHLSSR
jgi:CBS domain-containing protein